MLRAGGGRSGGRAGMCVGGRAAGGQEGTGTGRAIGAGAAAVSRCARAAEVEGIKGPSHPKGLRPEQPEGMSVQPPKLLSKFVPYVAT